MTEFRRSETYSRGSHIELISSRFFLFIFFLDNNSILKLLGRWCRYQLVTQTACFCYFGKNQNVFEVLFCLTEIDFPPSLSFTSTKKHFPESSCIVLGDLPPFMCYYWKSLLIGRKKVLIRRGTKFSSLYHLLIYNEDSTLFIFEGVQATFIWKFSKLQQIFVIDISEIFFEIKFSFVCLNLCLLFQICCFFTHERCMMKA